MKLKTLKLFFLSLAGLLFFPLLAYGFQLVPCGGSLPACTFNDLVVLLIRLINFLLAISAAVTMYYILMASWTLVTALGNPEKISTGKEALTRAIIGFAMILLSFSFINLVMSLLKVNCISGEPWWQNPIGCFL